MRYRAALRNAVTVCALSLFVVAGNNTPVSAAPLVYSRSGAIYVLDEVTSEQQQRLSTPTDREDCRHPALAPDGSSIAYVATNTSTGRVGIYLMEVRWGSGGLVYATAHRTLVETGRPQEPLPRPRFSREGDRIVFHMRDESGYTGAYLIPVAGGIASRITRPTHRDEYDPAFLPDGGIVYSSRGRIFAVNRDGRRRRAITRPTSELLNADQPVTTADGAEVIFRGTPCEGCRTRIFIISLDRRNLSPLTPEEYDATSPALSPNGQGVAFEASGRIFAASDAAGLTLLRGGTQEPALLAEGRDPSFADAPSGCDGTNRVAVCYASWKAIRNSPLRTGPDARAPQVLHDGRLVELRANEQFGRQSVRNASCDSTPGPRPSVNGYMWGYVVSGDKSGWINLADVTPDNGGPELCGPAGEDFDCRPDRRVQCTSICDGGPVRDFDPASGRRAITTQTYLRWAADSTPFNYLTPGDEVRLLARKDSGWSCVEVSRASWIPTGQRGWSSVCGDGVRHSRTEECDDGNTTACDGCSSTCTKECGNAVRECGEECDDGNPTNGDGCESNCFFTRYPCSVQCCNGTRWQTAYARTAEECRGYGEAGFCNRAGNWTNMYFNGALIASVPCSDQCGIECCSWSVTQRVGGLVNMRGPSILCANLGQDRCGGAGSGLRNALFYPGGAGRCNWNGSPPACEWIVKNACASVP